jgi:hypothetical protein
MLQVIHETTITCRCPHGPIDVYTVEFHLDKMVTVEDIQRVIDESITKPIYQEDLTKLLSDKIECKVVTSGNHLRFKTKCTYDPTNRGLEKKNSN